MSQVRLDKKPYTEAQRILEIISNLFPFFTVKRKRELDAQDKTLSILECLKKKRIIKEVKIIKNDFSVILLTGKEIFIQAIGSDDFQAENRSDDNNIFFFQVKYKDRDDVLIKKMTSLILSAYADEWGLKKTKRMILVSLEKRNNIFSKVLFWKAQ